MKAISINQGKHRNLGMALMGFERLLGIINNPQYAASEHT